MNRKQFNQLFPNEEAVVDYIIKHCFSGIYGVFHHISVKYMQNYIDEFCYR